MELFQSRKVLIIKGEFLRKVLNETTPYLYGDCTEKCKSVHEKYQYLSPPPPAVLTHHSHKVSTFLTGTITLIAVTFFFVCAYALYSKFQSNRIRRANLNPSPNPNDENEDEDRGTVEHHVWYIRTVGIDPATIASITAVKYRKDETQFESTDCSVCLSEFEEGEALRLLPNCRHAFHVACIDTWLRSHTNCPMCRAPVVVLPPEEEPKPPENDAGAESSADETVVPVVEPSRRSVSLGCLDDKELEMINKLRGNNSIGKKLQRMRSGNLSSSSSSSSSSYSSSMKRSSSCNGKFAMCHPIRVTDSILPLRSV